MVISITNLKGGVGKTTIATNLAVAFALKNKRVILLDTDKQASCVVWNTERTIQPAINVKSVILETNLAKVVETELQNYDVIIIDGAPSLDTLAKKTILVSDLVIIPIQPSLYDLRAYERFIVNFNECKAAKKKVGKQVFVVTLLNRVNPNTLLSKEVFEALSLQNVPILTTKLTNRISYADTITNGQSVLESKDHKAKAEMQNLHKEITEKLNFFYSNNL
jgi:chromosome partitioning protein